MRQGSVIWLDLHPQANNNVNETATPSRQPFRNRHLSEWYISVARQCERDWDGVGYRQLTAVRHGVLRYRGRGQPNRD